MNHNVSSVILFQTCGTQRSDTNESQMATYPCGPLPSHLLVLSPFVSHLIGLRRAHYSFETTDKSDELQPGATQPEE